MIIPSCPHHHSGWPRVQALWRPETPARRRPGTQMMPLNSSWQDVGFICPFVVIDRTDLGAMQRRQLLGTCSSLRTNV